MRRDGPLAFRSTGSRSFGLDTMIQTDRDRVQYLSESCPRAVWRSTRITSQPHMPGREAQLCCLVPPHRPRQRHCVSRRISDHVRCQRDERGQAKGGARERRDASASGIASEGNGVTTCNVRPLETRTSPTPLLFRRSSWPLEGSDAIGDGKQRPIGRMTFSASTGQRGPRVRRGAGGLASARAKQCKETTWRQCTTKEGAARAGRPKDADHPGAS